MSVDQSSERATTYFSINEITGEIEVLGDLKRELFENYLLSVVATDRGEPPISASMTIVIQVIKVAKESNLVIGDITNYLVASSFSTYLRIWSNSRSNKL